MKRDRIHFRDESAADQEFLYQLYASTRAMEMANVPWDGSQKEAFLRSQWQLQTAHYRTHYPEASFSLILDGDDRIGRFYVDRTLEDIHLLDLTLVPERRGEGIGTALLQELVAEAQQGRRSVTLYVEIFNPAQRLYHRLGFRTVQDEGVYLRMERPWQESATAQPPEAGDCREPGQ